MGARAVGMPAASTKTRLRPLEAAQRRSPRELDVNSARSIELMEAVHDYAQRIGFAAG